MCVFHRRPQLVTATNIHQREVVPRAIPCLVYYADLFPSPVVSVAPRTDGVDYVCECVSPLTTTRVRPGLVWRTVACSSRYTATPGKRWRR